MFLIAPARQKNYGNIRHLLLGAQHLKRLFAVADRHLVIQSTPEGTLLLTESRAGRPLFVKGQSRRRSPEQQNLLLPAAVFRVCFYASTCKAEYGQDISSQPKGRPLLWEYKEAMYDYEHILEFDKIKEQWASFAVTKAARERIAAVKPFLAESELRRELREQDISSQPKGRPLLWEYNPSFLSAI